MTSLTIITRHLPTRPQALARNIASLNAQTCDHKHFEQVILRGMPTMEAAQERLRYTPVTGAYVWILDDDDIAAPDAVSKILSSGRMVWDAAVFRFDHSGNVIPEYTETLREGRIGVSSLVVSRDVWNATRQNFGARYAGDWDWINSVISHHRYGRFDVCLGRTGGANNGQGDV